ncbi:hypothetical protein [Streptomyces sp. NPDC056844]|uniref:hypothetical protein n=1 Tax=unclassified Streptomyces TaxID=2593676 RepID=UPI0036800A7B
MRGVPGGRQPVHHPQLRGRGVQGTPDGIRVREPVTAWWHRSAAEAAAALARYTG